jgi:hypothetical protein
VYGATHPADHQVDVVEDWPIAQRRGQAGIEHPHQPHPALLRRSANAMSATTTAARMPSAHFMASKSARSGVEQVTP